MIQGAVDRLFLFKFLLSGFDLKNKQVHHFNSFFLNTGSYAVPLSQIIKGLKHVDSLFDRCNLFESEVNHILVHNIELFNSRFEGVVFIVPVRGLYIQNLVFLVILELLNQLTERSLDLL